MKPFRHAQKKFRCALCQITEAWSKLSLTPKMGKQVKDVNYFCEKAHLKCLTGF